MANNINVDEVRTQWMLLNRDSTISPSTRQSEKLKSLQKLAVELADTKEVADTVSDVWQEFEAYDLKKSTNPVGDLLKIYSSHVPKVGVKLLALDVPELLKNEYRSSK